MKKITINGKEYELKNITFAGMTKLEKLGFNIKTLQDIEGNYFGSVMSLAAFVMDCDTETASKEVEAHLEKGGELNDFAPLFDMVTESDFFRSLSKQQASKA